MRPGGPTQSRQSPAEDECICPAEGMMLGPEVRTEHRRGTTMATDYDAPRKNTDDESTESLEELQQHEQPPPGPRASMRTRTKPLSPSSCPGRTCPAKS